MSLSEPKKINPCKKFIEWQSSTGAFRYYDKTVEDYVQLPTPIYIVPLDKLSTITGYDDKQEKGIYSNEVHNLGKEELVVKYFKGSQIAKGLYADIKGQLPSGWKYAQSVYAAKISEGGSQLELVNFKLSGSSIGPWIDANVGDDGAVIVLDKNPELRKKGQTEFYEPTVKKSKIRQDILNRCFEMDKELQAYLKGEETQEESVAVKDDLPF